MLRELCAPTSSDPLLVTPPEVVEVPWAKPGWVSSQDHFELKEFRVAMHLLGPETVKVSLRSKAK